MLEKTRQGIVDDCYDTVIAIAASKYCKEFVIGYTHKPMRIRQYAYFNAKELGYEHLVILCDHLSQVDAHWVEGRLQEAIKNDEDNRHESDKYNAKRRLMGHSASAGGVKLQPEALQCSVYMAWRE